MLKDDDGILSHCRPMLGNFSISAPSRTWTPSTDSLPRLPSNNGVQLHRPARPSARLRKSWTFSASSTHARGRHIVYHVTALSYATASHKSSIRRLTCLKEPGCRFWLRSS